MRNELRIIPTLAEASTWERDRGIVKLKRATDADMQRHAYLVTLYTNRMLGQCLWKRVPRALVTADRMLPNPGQTTALGALFLNDTLFAQQGCGSPRTFFEPYLSR